MLENQKKKENMNNIIVLGSYFNLTNKSNLIDKPLIRLTRFFDHLVVTYFFGATLYMMIDIGSSVLMFYGTGCHFSVYIVLRFMGLAAWDK